MSTPSLVPPPQEGVGGWAEQWADTVRTLLEGLAAKMADFLPNLLGSLVILLIGWLISKAAQKIVALLFGRIGFDSIVEKVGLGSALSRANVRLTPSQIVGKLVFWFFMLTFLVSAAESIGLENVSQTLNSFVAYLPNVLAAMILLVIGLVLAGFVKNLVAGGAASMGLEFGGPLSNLIYGVVVIIVASLAVGQLKVQTELVNGLIQIVFIATAGATALALGLGTRDIAKKVICGVYARDLYAPGDQLTVGDVSGDLVEIGAITTVLEREDGQRLYVPNDQLGDLVVQASGGGPKAEGDEGQEA